MAAYGTKISGMMRRVEGIQKYCSGRALMAGGGEPIIHAAAPAIFANDTRLIDER